MNRFLLPNNNFSWTSAAVVILLIASLLPRFYELGKIGFQKDEEYTAFAASAVADGDDAKLPSGMSYRRALPLTYLSAGSALLFGTENEFSYRLPATLIGALSPIILFLLLRSTIGGTAAFISALMLAFSEWHILLSREARMYAPFLLFYTCTAIYCWQWIETNKRKYLMASIVFFAISVTLHQLALIAAIFLLIPLLTSSRTAVPWIRAIGLFVIFIVTAKLYPKFIVSPGYLEFSFGEARTQPVNYFESLYAAVLDKIPATNPALILLLLIIGAVAGYWLAQARKIKTNKLDIPLLNILAYYSLAIMTGMLTFTGLIYAATLTGILFFALNTGLPRVHLNTIRFPLGLLAVTALFWACLSIWQHGLHDGIKTISSFPFPYFAYFAFIAPGLLLLFLYACVSLFMNNGSTSGGLPFSIVATIIPIFMIGSVKEWGGARYLIGAYPFLIIASSIGLVTLIKLVGNKTRWWNKRGTVILAVTITASGILGGNGIPASISAATFNYGEPNYWSALQFPDYPDHQSAGRFVSNHLQASDIVVAEDASMQKWYAGRVDFWLRDYNDARRYLYRADDGNLRDIYVNSRIVTPETLKKFNVMVTNGERIWVITSGETYENRSYFLGVNLK